MARSRGRLELTEREKGYNVREADQDHFVELIRKNFVPMAKFKSQSLSLLVGLLLALMSTLPARAAEIHVMASGGFTAPYNDVIPEFEKQTGNKVSTAYGASMGGAPDSIPMRLERGEPVDIVIMADTALDELIKQGKVVAGSRVDLVRSVIGMAVQKGAAKPDISSVDALVSALLGAKSIAYSASASGTYLSGELFPKLGIAEKIKDKSKRIVSERVGDVVARGDAEIGFQQVSELLPIAGIDYVGPLPEGAQKVTVFSAGVATGAKNPAEASRLIQFLASSAVYPAIRKYGLEPASAK
jgi:molybdate transport system substrate-binding protein